MNYQDQRIPDLITRFEKGSATAAEISELEQWFQSFENDGKYTSTLSKDQRIALKTNLFSSINKGIDRKTNQEKRLKQNKKLSWFAFAAVLVLICGGIYLYNTSAILNSADENQYQNLDAKNDIKPGKNVATLTLANGKVLNLSGSKTGIVIDASKLSYSDGSKIKDPDINDRHPELVSGPRTIEIPRGGTYQIILPDSTHVWLNAASSLKFPATFTNLKERKVELTGEAYFVVKHNAKQPFRVETRSQIVEDIGTEFNINAYKDEGNTKTTLIEGSARVVSIDPTSTPRHSELVSEPRNRKDSMYGLNSRSGILKQVQDDVILKPGQQSLLSSNNRLSVQKADLENIIDWKNGDFVFNGEDFKAVMRKISRWYGVDIIYDPSAPTNIELGGWISRNSNISAVLKQIESTGSVRFKVEEKKITVMPD